MRHWQYTDVPSTCEFCGFKTCALPTYKRHVKHCSAEAAAAAAAAGISASSGDANQISSSSGAMVTPPPSAEKISLAPSDAKMAPPASSYDSTTISGARALQAPEYGAKVAPALTEPCGLETTPTATVVTAPQAQSDAEISPLTSGAKVSNELSNINRSSAVPGAKSPKPSGKRRSTMSPSAKTSAPSSAKMSKPSSAKTSTPSSAKMSTPPSAKVSTPSSPKTSKTSSAKTTPSRAKTSKTSGAKKTPSGAKKTGAKTTPSSAKTLKAAPPSAKTSGAKASSPPPTTLTPRIRKCRRCPFSTMVEKEFLFHQKNTHTAPGSLLFCDDCDFKCRQHALLYQHKSREHRPTTGEEEITPADGSPSVPEKDDRDSGKFAMASDGAKTESDGAKTVSDGAKTVSDDETTALDGEKTASDGAKTASDCVKTSSDGVKTVLDIVEMASDGAKTAPATSEERCAASTTMPTGAKTATTTSGAKRLPVPGVDNLSQATTRANKKTTTPTSAKMIAAKTSGAKMSQTIAPDAKMTTTTPGAMISGMAAGAAVTMPKPSGANLVPTPNGAEVRQVLFGAKLAPEPETSGIEMALTPSGANVVPSGTMITSMPCGSKVIKVPFGATTTPMPSGTKVITVPFGIEEVSPPKVTLASSVANTSQTSSVGQKTPSSLQMRPPPKQEKIPPVTSGADMTKKLSDVKMMPIPSDVKITPSPSGAKIIKALSLQGKITPVSYATTNITPSVTTVAAASPPVTKKTPVSSVIKITTMSPSVGKMTAVTVSSMTKITPVSPPITLITPMSSVAKITPVSPFVGKITPVSSPPLTPITQMSSMTKITPVSPSVGKITPVSSMTKVTPVSSVAKKITKITPVSSAIKRTPVSSVKKITTPVSSATKITPSPSAGKLPVTPPRAFATSVLDWSVKNLNDTNVREMGENVEVYPSRGGTGFPAEQAEKTHAVTTSGPVVSGAPPAVANYERNDVIDQKRKNEVGFLKSYRKFKMEKQPINSSLALEDGSSLALTDGSSVALKTGSSLTLKDGSFPALKTGSSLALKDGSFPALKTGSSLALNDGSCPALKDGSFPAHKTGASPSLKDGSSPALRKPADESDEPKRLTTNSGDVFFSCRVCNFANGDRATVVRHINVCYKQRRKFSCFRCSYVSDSKQTWKRHTASHDRKEASSLSSSLLPHAKTEYSCSGCSYATRLKKNFERHWACHTTVAAFKCSYCSYSSSGESAVRRHISSYHDGGGGTVAKKTEFKSGGGAGAVANRGTKKSSSFFDFGKIKKKRLESSTTKSGNDGVAKKREESATAVKSAVSETPSKNSMSKTETNSAKESANGTLKKIKSETAIESDVGSSRSFESEEEEEEEEDQEQEGEEEEEEEMAGSGDIRQRGKLNVDNLDDDDDGGVVWSCFLCNLDFKRRSDMEMHTKTEHSIDLTDCLLIDPAENDARMDGPFAVATSEGEPETPGFPVTEEVLQCAHCPFTARRRDTLRKHLKRKHSDLPNDRSERSTTTTTRKRRRHDDGSLASLTSKKMKGLLTAGDRGDVTTILSKLLRHDNPNAVYRTSNGNDEISIAAKKKTAKKNFDFERRVVAKVFSSVGGKIDDAENDVDPTRRKRIETVSDDDDDDNKETDDNDDDDDDDDDEESDNRDVEYLTSLMCSYCGYMGNHPGEVERHSKIHTGEKNYWCTLCDYKTIWKCDMKKHIAKFHSHRCGTADELRQLLHLAFRPDGRHTASELGYPLSASRRAISRNFVKLPTKKRIYMTKNRRDDATKSTPKVVVPKPNRAAGNFGEATSILIRRPITVVNNAASESTTKNVESVRSTVISAKVESTERNDAAPDRCGAVALSPPEDRDGRFLKRCRPYKCSTCGKRSNWKWDLKKHIAERHPSAALITMSDVEARQTFAEIVRRHQEKQKMSGSGYVSRSHRLRIGNGYDDDAGPRSRSEDVAVARALDEARAFGLRVVVSAPATAASSSEHPTRSPAFPVPARLLPIVGIKGMVDTQKLKRFKCSGCPYRSSFRGDISRHIRKMHAGRGCSITVMSASSAAASLASYSYKWRLRRRERTDTNRDDDDVYVTGYEFPGRDRPPRGSAGAQDEARRRQRPHAAESGEMRCCNVCPYVTEKSDLLKLHMSYHQPQARNGYSCSYCPFFVNTVRLLHHHLLLHAPKGTVVEALAAAGAGIVPPRFYYGVPPPKSSKDSKYVCDRCPFVSNARYDYWQHRRNHFEKPTLVLKCGACPYWAPDARTLSQHSKLHERGYYPRPSAAPAADDDVECRCDYAERSNDAALRCGAEMRCPYCSYAVSSVLLMRQHVVFHISFTDAAKTPIFDARLDDADRYARVPCRRIVPSAATEGEEPEREEGGGGVDPGSFCADERMNEDDAHEAELISHEMIRMASSGLDLEISDGCSTKTFCFRRCQSSDKMDDDDDEQEFCFEEMSDVVVSFEPTSSAVERSEPTTIDEDATFTNDQTTSSEIVSVVDLPTSGVFSPGDPPLSVVEVPLNEFLTADELAEVESKSHDVDAVSVVDLPSDETKTVEVLLRRRRTSVTSEEEESRCASECSSASVVELQLDEMGTPEGGETTPGGSETTPEGGETTPGGSETTPGGSETTPEGGETTPGGSETTPEVGETTPEGSDTAPEGGETATEGDKTTPEGDEMTPEGSETTFSVFDLLCEGDSTMVVELPSDETLKSSNLPADVTASTEATRSSLSDDVVSSLDGIISLAELSTTENSSEEVFGVFSMAMRRGRPEDTTERSAPMFVCADRLLRDENRTPENTNRISQNENRIPENENRIPENENRISENENRISENENRIPENGNRIQENGNRIQENGNRIPENGNRILENANRIPENKNFQTKKMEKNFAGGVGVAIDCYLKDPSERKAETYDDLFENKHKTFSVEQERCRDRSDDEANLRKTDARTVESESHEPCAQDIVLYSCKRHESRDEMRGNLGHTRLSPEHSNLKKNGSTSASSRRTSSILDGRKTSNSSEKTTESDDRSIPEVESGRTSRKRELSSGGFLPSGMERSTEDFEISNAGYSVSESGILEDDDDASESTFDLQIRESDISSAFKLKFMGSVGLTGLRLN